MKVAGLKWVWLYLMLLLVLASQTQAQTSVLAPIPTSTSRSQDMAENDKHWTHRVTTKATTEATVFTNTEEEPTTTPASTTQADRVNTASASESSSVTPSPLRTSTTQTAGHAFSSQPGSSSVDRTPSASSPTERQPPITASVPTTQQRSQGIAGKTHQEIPSQLNVGGKDFKRRGHRSNSLDPLLAGLLSVFIVTTAVVFVVLFLKFRQQNSNPEFHRLQDLPMDDLMEDTPLSRYTY